MGRRSKKQQRRSLQAGSKSDAKAEVFAPGSMDAAPVWKFWAASLVIAVAVIGVYWNTLGNGFVTWDDRDYIYENPLLEGGLGIIWGDLFSKKPHEQYYPVIFTSYWIEYQFVGHEPWLYHATQMVLHAINAILLIFVLRSLGVRLFPATVAGALFALHPINVASVAWVTERKNTLSMLFFLLALLLYVHYRRSDTRWRYPVAIIVYALGLLSKTVVLTLSPILILTDRLLDGRWTWASVRRSVPFFLLGITMMVITIKVEARQSKSRTDIDPLIKIPVAAAAITHYVSKVFVPTDLLPIYARWPDEATVVFTNSRYLVSMAAVAVAAFLVWRYRRWLGETVLWGIAFFLLVTFPMLGFKNFNFLQFSFVSDHFIYHGGPGIFLVVALLLDRVRYGFKSVATAEERPADGTRNTVSLVRTVPVCVLIAAVLAACSWLTVRHNRVWKNGVTFWECTLRGNPDCFPGNWNLGNYYSSRRDYANALKHYSESARILPTHVWSRQNCARCCWKLGQHDEAIAYYQDAIRIAGQTNRFAPDVRTEYADCLRMLGRLEAALTEYEAILSRDPKNSRAAEAVRQLKASTPGTGGANR